MTRDMTNSLELQQFLDRVAADFVKRLNLQVTSVAPGEVAMVMPVTDDLVHGGGVLCGQAMLAAADTAMLLALVAQMGEFKPVTTVQLQTSFLRPVPRGTAHVTVTGRVLRHGKTLSYGEVDITTPDGKLAAHATTTYALL
jgi:uncharacterized protein (TIGR00369 family)